MAEKKPVKFILRVDVQCGVCGSLTHHSAGETDKASVQKGVIPSPGPFAKFCACCGAGMERYCLRCHKKAEMFFEEWWPEDEECLRTYSPAKRCSGCNAQLGNEPAHGSELTN